MKIVAPDFVVQIMKKLNGNLSINDQFHSDIPGLMEFCILNCDMHGIIVVSYLMHVVYRIYVSTSFSSAVDLSHTYHPYLLC